MKSITHPERSNKLSTSLPISIHDTLELFVNSWCSAAKIRTNDIDLVLC